MYFPMPPLLVTVSARLCNTEPLVTSEPTEIITRFNLPSQPASKSRHASSLLPPPESSPSHSKMTQREQPSYRELVNSPTYEQRVLYKNVKFPSFLFFKSIPFLSYTRNSGPYSFSVEPCASSNSFSSTTAVMCRRLTGPTIGTGVFAAFDWWPDVCSCRPLLEDDKAPEDHELLLGKSCRCPAPKATIPTRSPLLTMVSFMIRLFTLALHASNLVIHGPILLTLMEPLTSIKNSNAF
mmetsp:Transcript_5840/g.16479  ORF Transcript_5840/g.16479 Transcript_5840/m.16479 type:complete len:238 (-) Transcript_5840:3127-3840(-)